VRLESFIRPAGMASGSQDPGQLLKTEVFGDCEFNSTITGPKSPPDCGAKAEKEDAPFPDTGIRLPGEVRDGPDCS